MRFILQLIALSFCWFTVFFSLLPWSYDNNNRNNASICMIISLVLFLITIKKEEFKKFFKL